MTPPGLRIALDRPNATYKAGEDITGIVRVAPTSPTAVWVDVFVGWRVEGAGNPYQAPEVHTALCAGVRLRPEDEPTTYPFTLPASTWPPSYDGNQLLSVRHYVRAEVRAQQGDPAQAELTLTLLPGPATFEVFESMAPRHTDATAGMPSSLGSAAAMITLAVGMGFANAAANSAGDEALAAIALFLSLLAAVAAAVLFVHAVRNYAAERRVGRVFVGLAPSAPAGRPLSCLVRFQAASGVTVNSITAVLLGEEVVTRGEHKQRSTTRKTLNRQELVFSRRLTLDAGEAFESELLFAMPEDTAPSLTFQDNAVEWKVSIRIDIAGWPDWVHSYPIQVTPPSSLRITATRRFSVKLQDGQCCPLCRDAVTHGEDLTTCAGCRTVFHKECIREFGACSTRGCGRGRLRA